MSDVDLSTIYFESCWSILSSIGIVNVIIGLLVVGITRLSPITIVPIIVSAATALASGLCFYAFYEDHPPVARAVASSFADIFWMIQETGLSMYNYQILIRILPIAERRLFKCVYWFLLVSSIAVKIPVLCLRVDDILIGEVDHAFVIDHLHIGYFLGIAFLEMWSSYFLLRKFLLAETTSQHSEAAKTGLFKYLMRSTELRLAGLSLISIARSVTFSFQTTAQSAVSLTGQVDRFVYFLECIFPMIMYIDILAAKTIGQNAYSYHRINHRYAPKRPSHVFKTQNSWPSDPSSSMELPHIDQSDDLVRYRSGTQAVRINNGLERIVQRDYDMHDNNPSY